MSSSHDVPARRAMSGPLVPPVPPGASTASPGFRTWKKNALFLYDQLATHGLTWPSLTAQFFPDRHESSDGAAGPATAAQRLLLGTHTSGQRDDFILLAQVKLPAQLPEPDPSAYDEDRGEIGSYSARPPVLSIAQMIPHPGEVNRARYCPQNPDLIATRTRTGSTLLFDRTKHPSMPDGGVDLAAHGPQLTPHPDIHLDGQTKEGYGLAWSPSQYGHIIASSGDGTVAHWDLHQYQARARRIAPLRTYGELGGGEVEDCAWHSYSPDVFASVGMGDMVVYDTRTAGRPLARTPAHAGDANAVAFAPASHTLLATAGDNEVKLWDLRRLAQPLTTMTGHSGEVLSLAWSPIHQGLLASSGTDGQVLIWDTSIGTLRAMPADSPAAAAAAAPAPAPAPDQAQTTTPTGPDSAQLVFRHGGHTARPNDVAWSHHDPWLLASVGDDNMAQIWRPARAVVDAYAWPEPSSSHTTTTTRSAAQRPHPPRSAHDADDTVDLTAVDSSPVAGPRSRDRTRAPRDVVAVD